VTPVDGSRCPLLTYKLATSSPTGITQSDCETAADTTDCRSIQFPLDNVLVYKAYFEIKFLGDFYIKDGFEVEITVKKPPCYTPFIGTGVVLFPTDVYLDSSTKMAL
jgi:hypothetical protein